MLKNHVEQERPGEEELGRRLEEARKRLGALQMQIKEHGLPVLVLMEGWGAAGKGSLIGKIIKNIDPRFFKVATMENIGDQEDRYQFLHRYFVQITEAGKFTFLDSGWMNEICMGRARKELDSKEYAKKVESVQRFERQLVDNGYLVIKFFCHISREEQKKRMMVRKDRYFDLEGLPSEEVRKLLEDFVWERGKKLAPSSLASEILYFNTFRNFLIEKNIKILRYEDENKIILQLKSWMMEKGYALTSKKYRSVYEIVATETPGIIKHMKKLLRYSQKAGGCLEQA